MSYGVPRYITLDDVKNRTVNKVYYSNTYNLNFNPGPDLVSRGAGSTVILTWYDEPEGWQTFNMQVGLAGIITQSDAGSSVTGNYKGISNAGWSMVIDNVTGGTFTTSDSVLEREDGNGLITLENGDGIGLIDNSITCNLTDGGVTDDLLGDIISIAESEIERRLSPFYLVPFVAEFSREVYTPYDTLPLSSSSYLKDMFIILTLIKLLDMEFGRQDGDRGDSYKKDVKGEFAYKMSYLTTLDPSGKFLYPPLEDLARRWDSFQYNSYIPAPASVNGGCSVNSSIYANQHINNPSRGFFFGSNPRGSMTCVTKQSNGPLPR